MYKKLVRKKIISSSDVSRLVRLIEKYGLTVISIGKGGEYKSMNEMRLRKPLHSLSNYIIIELKERRLEITTKYIDGKACTYICDLNDEESFSASGQRCFTEFSKYFKVVKAKGNEAYKFLDKWFNEEQGKYVCSASPIVNYNKLFENKELTDCYEYDLNSAYSSVLLNKIPDLANPIYEPFSKVKKGEVGFILDDKLTMTEVGQSADVRFPLIEAPQGLIDFCIKYYTKKKNTSGVDKLEAKAMLNLPIGYCQRYNPFLRAYVVNKCNQVIKKLIDKNTLFWNTDALFSRVKRDDLKIGDNIGEFKEIHCKTLRYVGNTYQVNDELPTYRGVPKAWFRTFEKVNGRPFNILTDKLPTQGNTYNWNWEKLQLEEVSYEKID